MLLTAAVERQYEDPMDVNAALVPDGLGIGSGSDVIDRDGRPIGRPAAKADAAAPDGRG